MCRSTRTIASGLVAALAGCASPSAPPLPKDFSLADAIVVADVDAPKLDVSGLPGGKAVGAGVGAGTGGGAGALAGAAACLAAGPFAPLCLLAVVPTTAAIGAVTGGVVGAVKTESMEAIAAKTVDLTKELVSSSYQTRVAEALQAELNDKTSLGVSLAEPRAAAPLPSGAASGAGRLIVNVGIVQIGTEGKSEFALRLVTRAQVRRKGAGEVVYQVSKEVQSEAELTIVQWMANDAHALRGVMQRCLREASHNLAMELSPAARGSAKREYSTSCNDVDDDWKAPVSAQLKGLPAPDRFAVGDRWEWRQFDNRTQVEEGRFSRAVVTGGSEPLFLENASTKKMSDVFIDGGYDPSQRPWRTWPLEVGKKWVFDGTWHRADGASGNTRQDVHVVTFEEVKVPAGTFMAFKIEARGFYRNFMGGSARQNDVYWYAPDADCDVKHVREDDRNFYTQELVSFHHEASAQRAADGVHPR